MQKIITISGGLTSDELIFDESKAKTPGLMFSFYWFLKNQKELGL